MKSLILLLIVALLAGGCSNNKKMAIRKKDKGQWIESRADNYTEVNAVSL